MTYIYELKRKSYPNHILETSLLEHEKKYSIDELRKIISNAEYNIEEYCEEYTDDKYNETMESICDIAEENYLEAIADYLITYNKFKRHIVKKAISIHI